MTAIEVDQWSGELDRLHARFADLFTRSEPRRRARQYLIAAHPGKVDGIKLSLLDEDFEVAVRRRLPAGVRLYTGDDFHYPILIRGDAHGHSGGAAGHLRRDRTSGVRGAARPGRG